MQSFQILGQLIDPTQFELHVTVDDERAAAVTLKMAPSAESSNSRNTLRSMLSRLESLNWLKIMIGIAAGMKHLHDHALAHMNLSDSNIVISENSSVDIINLGTAHNFANGATQATESQQNNSNDAKADVFNFAFILYEMFTGELASECIRKLQLSLGMAVVGGEYPTLPSYIPAQFVNLIKKCWSQRPDQRPTFTQILDTLQTIPEIPNPQFPTVRKSVTVYRPSKKVTRDVSKYHGIIPAFYACYTENQLGIDQEMTKKFTQYLIDQGVKGLYVGGSSGECIYQTVKERKETLEAVMEVAKGKITIIAHVGCNGIAESQELAKHAEGLGVDAIASIPPIYFKLPEKSIANYWNAISDAAPNTDFVIYNIPQLAGVALTPSLLKEMLKNPRVVGVKNSSEPTQDIQRWRDIFGDDQKYVVFNGPDEQLVSGLIIGASGGIGGTYATMPKLIRAAYDSVQNGQNTRARDIQNDICRIIYKFQEASGNLYSTMKNCIKYMTNGDIDCRDVRSPMLQTPEAEKAIWEEAAQMIKDATAKYA